MPFTVKQDKLSLDFCLKCFKGLVSLDFRLVKVGKDQGIQGSHDFQYI